MAKIEYRLGNYLSFMLGSEDGDPEREFTVGWEEDPRQMAVQLRQAADWLEAHADDPGNIYAAVD